jgi:hypothetical protein
VTIRRQRIEDSFPNASDSADTETTATTLQDLLLTLADGQEEIFHQGTPGIAELTDDEGSNEILDISALSVLLLGQLDDDQGLDLHQMGWNHGLAFSYPSYSILIMCSGLGGVNDDGAAPPKWIRLQSHEELNPWFPWPNKIVSFAVPYHGRHLNILSRIVLYS